MPFVLNKATAAAAAAALPPEAAHQAIDKFSIYGTLCVVYYQHASKLD
jgi:hypothetical protein